MSIDFVDIVRKYNERKDCMCYMPRRSFRQDVRQSPQISSDCSMITEQAAVTAACF